LKGSVFCATLGGAGLLGKAPGTVGTALAAVVFWFLCLGSWGMLFLALLLSVVAVPISTAAEHELGARDPGAIVIDEAVGMAIAVLGLPHDLLPWLLAFIAFRFFDIIKPLGIDHVQRWPAGLGVVADDALAGIYAAISVHAVLFILS
jgi:phosphatidylglycerophosphatase A